MTGTPIQWAVALGCTTPLRLADEWSISYGAARELLERAVAGGLIWKVSDGYACKPMEMQE